MEGGWLGHTWGWERGTKKKRRFGLITCGQKKGNEANAARERKKRIFNQAAGEGEMGSIIDSITIKVA